MGLYRGSNFQILPGVWVLTLDFFNKRKIQRLLQIASNFKELFQQTQKFSAKHIALKKRLPSNSAGLW